MKFRKDIGVLLVLIISFCLLIGTASAIYTTTYSSNGKIINVVKPTLKSDLDATFHVTEVPINNIIYRSMKAEIKGKDYTGRTIYQYGTVTVSHGFLVPSKLIVSNGGFKWVSSIQRSGSSAFTEKITGNMNPTSTFTGNSFNTLNTNGYVKKRVTTLKFLHSGVKTASCSIISVPVYQTGTGSILKWTETMKTLFTNGNIRSSIITTNYKRNSYGMIQGMTTSGISYGLEKVNGKKVTYHGKISIPTRFTSSNGYHLGSYREVKTSSSSTLNKIRPYEAMLYDNYIIHPEQGVITPPPMNY